MRSTFVTLCTITKSMATASEFGTHSRQALGRGSARSCPSKLSLTLLDNSMGFHYWEPSLYTAEQTCHRHQYVGRSINMGGEGWTRRRGSERRGGYIRRERRKYST